MTETLTANDVSEAYKFYKIKKEKFIQLDVFNLQQKVIDIRMKLFNLERQKEVTKNKLVLKQARKKAIVLKTEMLYLRLRIEELKGNSIRLDNIIVF